MRRLDGSPELLDGPLDAALLRGNLRDLARVNRLLGGAELSRRALDPLRRELRPTNRLRVLDVGTGAADIPIYLTHRFAKSQPGLEIVATDVRPEIVQLAADNAAGREVEVRLGHLADEADASFHAVHASLVLHHLDPEAAVAFLRDAARVASRAVIVNDLDRARRWFVAARLLTMFTTLNRYTRHDAPLSVRRAHRPDELAALAGQAGLAEEARYWTHPRYRYAMVFRHG